MSSTHKATFVAMLMTLSLFQIGTRHDAEDGGKGRSVDTTGVERVMKFDRWGKSYTVLYRDPCR